MDLILDVGNTNIVIGVYNNDKLLHLWRYATSNVSTSDVFGLFIDNLLTRWDIDSKKIQHVIISSVAPNVMHSLENSILKYFNITPIIANCTMSSNISLDVFEDPNFLGVDRYVNCIAGFNKYGGNAIIIDFGTATTYDVIDKNGNFVTGITSPGIKISADALSQKASLLGTFQISKPESFIPTNTLESLQVGLIYGQIGQTEYIVNKIKKELNKPDMKVIVTGGLSSIISDGTDIIDFVDTTLTLDGIKLLLDENK